MIGDENGPDPNASPLWGYLLEVILILVLAAVGVMMIYGVAVLSFVAWALWRAM